MDATRGLVSGIVPASVPARPLVGLSFFVPGAPQWLWRQHERAFVLFGSFATAIGVGLFAWGTRTGLALLAVAYLVHVVSAADAIRQWSFPGFGRWIPACSASAGLALGCYGPLLLMGSVFAWPGFDGDAGGDGYLVDRSAYASGTPGPAAGDRIWIGGGRQGRRGRVVDVVANPGQNVEWREPRLHVNGKSVALVPFRLGEAPPELEFQVPDGQLLVSCPTIDPLMPVAWEFVPVERVEGRAWAKIYPVWSRRLLH